MKITVVGSTHIDFYIRLPKLPSPGETVLGKEFIMKPGGKGANQAIAVARLGGESYMVSRVGNDIFGEKLIENFKKNHVDTKHVYIDNEAHTGTAFILLDENTGENMIAVAPGADNRVSKEDIDKAIDTIKASKILLLQLEIPIETVVYAAKKAWENNVKVILNPAPARPLPDEIYRYVHVITPNMIEVGHLTNTVVKNIDDAIEAGKKLVSKGVEYVVVTMGARGSLVISSNFVEHIPAYKVKAVDTTGAGDAFNGALAVFLAEGKDIVEACRLANAAAALKITRVGAQEGLPTREELINFLSKYHNI